MKHEILPMTLLDTYLSPNPTHEQHGCRVKAPSVIRHKRLLHQSGRDIKLPIENGVVLSPFDEMGPQDWFATLTRHDIKKYDDVHRHWHARREGGFAANKIKLHDAVEFGSHRSEPNRVFGVITEITEAHLTVHCCAYPSDAVGYSLFQKGALPEPTWADAYGDEPLKYHYFVKYEGSTRNWYTQAVASANLLSEYVKDAIQKKNNGIDELENAMDKWERRREAKTISWPPSSSWLDLLCLLQKPTRRPETYLGGFGLAKTHPISVMPLRPSKLKALPDFGHDKFRCSVKVHDAPEAKERAAYAFREFQRWAAHATWASIDTLSPELVELRRALNEVRLNVRYSHGVTEEGLFLFLTTYDTLGGDHARHVAMEFEVFHAFSLKGARNDTLIGLYKAASRVLFARVADAKATEAFQGKPEPYAPRVLEGRSVDGTLFGPSDDMAWYKALLTPQRVENFSTLGAFGLAKDHPTSVMPSRPVLRMPNKSSFGDGWFEYEIDDTPAARERANYALECLRRSDFVGDETEKKQTYDGPMDAYGHLSALLRERRLKLSVIFDVGEESEVILSVESEKLDGNNTWRKRDVELYFTFRDRTSTDTWDGLRRLVANVKDFTA